MALYASIRGKLGPDPAYVLLTAPDGYMILDPADTIAAIASPPGPGHRGIIRLSGPLAWEIGLEGFEASTQGALLPSRNPSAIPRLVRQEESFRVIFGRN